MLPGVGMTARARRLRWAAGRDGVSHGTRDGIRNVCGSRALDLRFAWPERERCPTCLRLALGAAS